MPLCVVVLTGMRLWSELMECVTLPIRTSENLTPAVEALMVTLRLLPTLEEDADTELITGRVAAVLSELKRYGGLKIWPSAWSTALLHAASEEPGAPT